MELVESLDVVAGLSSSVIFFECYSFHFCHTFHVMQLSGMDYPFAVVQDRMWESLYWDVCQQVTVQEVFQMGFFWHSISI